MNSEYSKAKEKLLAAADSDCQQFFIKNSLVLETAYYELLNNKPVNARKLFLQISDMDIRAHWGAFISAMVTGKIDEYPSYFELRNFFEIDLNLFLQRYLGNYVENIVKYLDWLCTINPEVHKFTGRVFLKNGYTEYGLFYLNRAQDYFFQDPELHYLLAEYFVSVNDLDNANISLKNCLKILPEYFPAINLQKKLNINCK